MLKLLATLALANPVMDAGQPQQLTIDPLGRAAHRSALCDCPDPLVNYLTYDLAPQVGDTPPTATQSGGVVHVALMTLINERWGLHYDLTAYNQSSVAPSYIDEWHGWIEHVQFMHGVAPTYVHAVDGKVREPWPKTPPRSDSRTPMSTGIQLFCSNCAEALCDAQRLAMAARTAMINGDYRQECVNGCLNADDEMHSRLIALVYQVGPVLNHGWTFKIRAEEASDPILEQVHGKVTPIYGETLSVDLGVFGIDIPVFTTLRGYKIHILHTNGTWVAWEFDLNQPAPHLAPPGFPYPECHPYNDEEDANGPVGSSGGAAAYDGGCYVMLPQPMH